MTGGEQLALPLDFVPSKVRRHGLRDAHPRPLVSLGKRPGQPVASFRTSPQKAWRYPAIEYGRAGANIAALVLDCDDPPKLQAGLADLPPPNWIVRRVANDHAHATWTLAKPVHRYPDARLEPLEYLAAVGDYYAAAVGADPGFAGVLCHNPTPRYRSDEFATTWGREVPYSLDDLASVIPFGWQQPAHRQTGIGRNCDLFASGMAWAGERRNRSLAVLPALMTLNQGFDIPLPHGEVAATARQIEKYRARWEARCWHSPKWIARQAARGRASGRARREGSNEERKPWKAEGISRAWWYERRRRASESERVGAPPDQGALSVLVRVQSRGAA